MHKSTVNPIQKPDRLASYWLRNKGITFAILFFGITFNGGMSIGPILQGRLLDGLLSGAPMAELAKSVTLFLSVIFLIQTLRYFKRFYVRKFANNTVATMQFMVYNHILHKEQAEIDGENTGNLLTRTQADVVLCVEGMRKATTEVFDTGVLMAGYFISLMFYDPFLTPAACLFVPLAMWLAERLKSVIYKFQTNYRKQAGAVASATLEQVENALLLRVNGRQEAAARDYDIALQDLCSKATKAELAESAMQPIYNVIALAGVVFVMYYGGMRVIEGSWSIGDFAAYLTIFLAIATKASKAAKLFNSLQRARISWLRIRPYLHEFRTEDTQLHLPEEPIFLEVKNLSLTYPNAKEPVLQNISFSAKAGEIIGITGPVACGKSTLAIALTGLYPYGGNVRINKKELRDYTPYERSHLIAYEGHDPSLFSCSIQENIIFDKQQDISSVLEQTRLAKDLESMPEGLATEIGGAGTRISGGQQARVALARALCAGSKIVILDDPFAAVDMQTEREIFNALRSQYPDTVFLMISHRLAIFEQADKVLLLQKDRPPAFASHEQLLQTEPLYAAIARLQTGGGEQNE